ATDEPVPEPLPPTEIGQVAGLLGVLAAHGGEMDLFDLDRLTEYPFGRTLAVVKAGEMLDLLDTPKDRVVLTDGGRRFVEGDVNARKRLLNERLRAMPTFQFVV